MAYIEITKIQNELKKYFEAFGTCTTIPQVIQSLVRNPDNLLDDDINPFPPDSAELDDDLFIDYFDRSRFPVHLLTKSLTMDNWKKGDSIFSRNKYVQIFRHMNFTNQQNHCHMYYEITYTLKGSCVMNFDNNQVPMRSGDVCIIAPFSMHEIMLLDENAFVMNIIMTKAAFESAFRPIMIYGDLISTYLQTILYQEDMANYLYISTSNSKEIKSYLKAATYESREESYYSSSRAINWIGLFFGTILHEFRHSIHMHHFDNSMVREDYLLLMQYIQNNYKTATLESVARIFNYNKSYLSRLIKKLTGKSFMEIVTGLKLERACDYLRATDLSINDIAELCGYNDQNYFTKAFKKMYQIIPSDYRAKEQRIQKENNDTFYL